jgi:hypothetical protein
VEAATQAEDRRAPSNRSFWLVVVWPLVGWSLSGSIDFAFAVGASPAHALVSWLPCADLCVRHSILAEFDRQAMFEFLLGDFSTDPKYKGGCISRVGS